MAPTDQRMKNKGKFSKGEPRNNRPAGVNKKRKWVPEHKKVFDGSVGEGQGFAFKRKQKIQHEYNKLLRKERRKNPEAKVTYKEEYPEHLRHLYIAEAEKLKNEAQNNRLKRQQLRMGGYGEEKAEDTAVDGAPSDQAAGPGQEAVADVRKQTDTTSVTPEILEAKELDSFYMSNRMKKKMMRKTSYQKTQEEFESITEKRKMKKEEFLRNKQQREEAIQKYQQKKMEAFQVLNKKTKKGQPNFNIQMEYLLQKIQESGK